MAVLMLVDMSEFLNRNLDCKLRLNVSFRVCFLVRYKTWLDSPHVRQFRTFITRAAKFVKCQNSGSVTGVPFSEYKDICSLKS